MTHIATDLYDSSLHVYHRSLEVGKQIASNSKEHAQKGIEQATTIYQQQMEKHWPAIQPHYEEHIKGNYEKHVAPHLQKHVFPRTRQASTWYKTTAVPLVKEIIRECRSFYDKVVVPRVKEMIEGCHSSYEDVVVFYGKECRSALSAYRKASKEHDFLKMHPLPKSVLHTWKDSCSHPEESIEAFAYGFLALIGLIFYRRVLGMIWWILNFVLVILCMVTPLGLVISPRRRSSGSSKPADQDNNDTAIPDVTSSFSESPDAMKSPGGPYRNLRSTRKSARSGT
jgi:hypothetical protein